jgi:hypothetical protein
LYYVLTLLVVRHLLFCFFRGLFTLKSKKAEQLILSHGRLCRIGYLELHEWDTVAMFQYYAHTRPIFVRNSPILIVGKKICQYTYVLLYGLSVVILNVNEISPK